MRTWPESTYSECETFTDEDTARWCRPSAWTRRSPGHGACCCCPAGVRPTAPGRQGSAGPRGSQWSPSLRRPPGRGRGRPVGCLGVLRRGGFDWRSGLCRHGLGFRDAARDSLRVALTWPRGAGGLSLLPAALWGCAAFAPKVSGLLGLRGSLQFRFPGRSCFMGVTPFCSGFVPAVGCAWGLGSAVGVTVGRMVSGSVGWLPASRLPASRLWLLHPGSSWHHLLLPVLSWRRASGVLTLGLL